MKDKLGNKLVQVSWWVSEGLAGNKAGMKYRGMFLFALLNLSNMKTITALLLLALLSLACLGQQICK